MGPRPGLGLCVAETTSKTWTDAERIAALKAYDILDTPREFAFDGIARLLAQVFEAPIALVNFIDADRAWFKAEVGTGMTGGTIETSFCAVAIREGDSDRMVVADAALDSRFADNPFVTGEPGLRFYAGQILRTKDGLPLGALCVHDVKPRPSELTQLQATTLEVLAGQVMDQLELRRTLKACREAEQAASRALQASDYVGAWDWDIEQNHVVADRRFAEMYGVDPDRAREGVPIETFAAAIHPEDADRVAADIDAAISSLGPYESEYRVLVGGRERWLMTRGQVYGDEGGAPLRFPGVAVDITARKSIETELARTIDALGESEAKFRAIADSMPQMVWSTLPDGFHDYYNARWYEYTGVPAGSTDGEGWNGMFHPEDQERAWGVWRHSLETGDLYEIEYRLRHHSGQYRWVLGRATPIRDADGQITRWFGTCTDIDELKKLEAGQALLSQELSHRIKNIFAVVSALIALSAREHPEAKVFAAAVRNRIAALARAHEFVRPHTEASRPTVGTLTLHAFLGALFQPYADDEGRPRVLVTGDDAVFDDQAATSVALLFHELATNAAKYGALAQPDGRVHLATESRDDRFVLTWTERGGPVVASPPTRSGFGSSLATVSVESQLGGRLERIWDAAGLKVVADLPATALSRRRAAMKTA